MAPIFDSRQAMNCDKVVPEMNFYNGYSKLFQNTKKDFQTYLQEMDRS